MDIQDIYQTKEEINSIHLHPNGNFIAAGDDSGQVYAIDLRNKRPFKHIRTRHENVSLKCLE